MSCTQPVSVPNAPSARDVETGAKLARDAGAILLQYSAYDYGLAGALAGEQTRTVAARRFGVVARDNARAISAFSGNVLTATVDRAGPLRDKLVPLADALADLSKDGVAYADGADPASFARVLADVTAGWQRLRELT